MVRFEIGIALSINMAPKVDPVLVVGRLQGGCRGSPASAGSGSSPSPPLLRAAENGHEGVVVFRAWLGMPLVILRPVVVPVVEGFDG